MMTTKELQECFDNGRYIWGTWWEGETQNMAEMKVAGIYYKMRDGTHATFADCDLKDRVQSFDALHLFPTQEEMLREVRLEQMKQRREHEWAIQLLDEQIDVSSRRIMNELARPMIDEATLTNDSEKVNAIRKILGWREINKENSNG